MFLCEAGLFMKAHWASSCLIGFIIGGSRFDKSASAVSLD